MVAQNLAEFIFRLIDALARCVHMDRSCAQQLIDHFRDEGCFWVWVSHVHHIDRILRQGLVEIWPEIAVLLMAGLFWDKTERLNEDAQYPREYKKPDPGILYVIGGHIQ